VNADSKYIIGQDSCHDDLDNDDDDENENGGIYLVHIQANINHSTTEVVKNMDVRHLQYSDEEKEDNIMRSGQNAPNRSSDR